MVRKIENAKDKTKKTLGYSMLAGSVILPAAAMYKKYLSDEEFFNSPEYKKFLEDPRFEKYIDVDDGSFWKAGSLEKLERKYKRQYEYRMKGKPLPDYLK